MGKDNAGFELGAGLSQSKDGTYLARTTLRNGVRKQKSFQTIKSAERWLNSVKQQNKSVEQCEIRTVGQWFDDWIEVYKRGRVKESSIETYTYHYLRYIDCMIGNKTLYDITSMDCQRVLNNARSITSSGKVIEQVRTIMYGMFDSATCNGYMDKNPISRTVKPPTTKKKDVRWLSAEEQRLFLETSIKYRFREQFLLMLNTGMRVGEVCGLKWKDIDFKRNIIRVNRTLTRVNGKLIEQEPKTEHSKRTVPMNDCVVNILESIERKSEYVFVNDKCRPIERNCYNHVLRNICDDCGIERISCHTLRHTFATRCIENGMKPKILQKILGHANIGITMDLYVHASDDEIIREMNLVGNIAI